MGVTDSFKTFFFLFFFFFLISIFCTLFTVVRNNSHVIVYCTECASIMYTFSSGIVEVIGRVHEHSPATL